MRKQIPAIRKILSALLVIKATGCQRVNILQISIVIRLMEFLPNQEQQ